MEEVDELIRVEKILKIVEEEMEKEIEDARALAKGEVEAFKKRMEREFERKKDELRRRFEEERRKMEKLHDSKKKALLNRYRSKLKGELFQIAEEKIRKLVVEDVEVRKVFLKRGVEKLSSFKEGGMKLVCAERDLEFLREIFEGEVDPSGAVESLKMVSKDGKSSIIYDLDEFTSEVLEFLKEKIKKEVGDLG